MNDRGKIFDSIYSSGKWGALDYSGDGSLIDNSIEWVNLVNLFIESKKVNSILDLGCGDGNLLNFYNFDKVFYTGVDVSKRILLNNKNTINKKFINSDIEIYDYQYNDLILIKDVLQHLNNNSIIKILNKIESSCKYALICNDFNDDNNIDILDGNWRHINLSLKPFYKKYKIIKKYEVKNYKKAVYLYVSE